MSPQPPTDGRGAPAGPDAPPVERDEAEAERVHLDAAHRAATRAANREFEALKEHVEDEHGGEASHRPDPDASMLEAARALLDAAQQSARAAGATASSFGHLVRSDLSLAVTSVVSGSAAGLGAAVAALTTWFLLIAMLVVGLQVAGLPLWGALGAAAALTLAVAAAFGLLAKRWFGSATMQATRRQWRNFKRTERPT